MSQVMRRGCRSRSSPESNPARAAAPGRQVLHEDVGAGDDAVQQGVVAGILDVEDDRFLAAVEPDEPGALAIHHMVVKPREVALRPLDLDDARARIGEPAGGEGRGDGLFDRDHQEAGERPFRGPDSLIAARPLRGQ